MAQPKQNGDITNIATSISTTRGSAGPAPADDDREEGEIVDDYEFIISSESDGDAEVNHELLSMRRRIQELEAKNEELAKIARISSESNTDYGYAPQGAPALGIVRNPFGHHNGLPAAGHAKVPHRDRQRSQHKRKRHRPRHNSRSRDRHHRSRNRTPTHYEERSPRPCGGHRRRRSTTHTSDDFEISTEDEENHQNTSARYVNRDALRFALSRSNSKSYDKVYDKGYDRGHPVERPSGESRRNVGNARLRERSINERNEQKPSDVKKAANKKAEQVGKNEDCASDDSEDMEVQELRLIALKSAVIKKHIKRKKHNEENPYSPSDFGEYVFSAHSSQESLDELDRVPLNASSPISPQNLMEEEDMVQVLSDESTHPDALVRCTAVDTKSVDMDLANSDSGDDVIMIDDCNPWISINTSVPPPPLPPPPIQHGLMPPYPPPFHMPPPFGMYLPELQLETPTQGLINLEDIPPPLSAHFKDVDLEENDMDCVQDEYEPPKHPESPPMVEHIKLKVPVPTKTEESEDEAEALRTLLLAKIQAKRKAASADTSTVQNIECQKNSNQEQGSESPIRQQTTKSPTEFILKEAVRRLRKKSHTGTSESIKNLNGMARHEPDTYEQRHQHALVPYQQQQKRYKSCENLQAVSLNRGDRDYRWLRIEESRIADFSLQVKRSQLRPIYTHRRRYSLQESWDIDGQRRFPMDGMLRRYNTVPSLNEGYEMWFRTMVVNQNLEITWNRSRSCSRTRQRCLVLIEEAKIESIEVPQAMMIANDSSQASGALSSNEDEEMKVAHSGKLETSEQTTASPNKLLHIGPKEPIETKKTEIIRTQASTIQKQNTNIKTAELKETKENNKQLVVTPGKPSKPPRPIAANTNKSSSSPAITPTQARVTENSLSVQRCRIAKPLARTAILAQAKTTSPTTKLHGRFKKEAAKSQTIASATTKKIVKRNKIINTHANTSGPLKSLMTSRSSSPFVPNAGGTRLLTASDLAPVKVQKIVINLNGDSDETETDTEYNCLSGDDNPVESASRQSPSLSNYRDIDSPLSLPMDSPDPRRDTTQTPTSLSGPTAAETLPMPRTAGGNVTVDEGFEQKLNHFLMNMRTKATNAAGAETLVDGKENGGKVAKEIGQSRREIKKELPKATASKNEPPIKKAKLLTQTIPTKTGAAAKPPSPPKVENPTAVRHLPTSAQQEYQRLVQRMKLLETQKQAKKQYEKLKKVNEVKQKSKEEQLEEYEASYNRVSSSIRAHMEKSLELVEEAKNIKIARMTYEKRMEKLRRELDELQRKSEEEQKKMSLVFPEIAKANRFITTMHKKCTKLHEEATRLGCNLKGPGYSLNQDMKKDIQAKQKILAKKIKFVNSLKYEDIDRLLSVNKDENLEPRVFEKKKVVPAKRTERAETAQEVMDTAPQEAIADRNKATVAVQVEEVTLAKEAIGIEVPVRVDENVQHDESPGRSGKSGTGVSNPHNVLCNHALFGDCLNTKCPFIHATKDTPTQQTFEPANFEMLGK